MTNQADALAADALYSLADGVMLVNAAGQIVLFNSRAQEILNVDAGAWRDKPASAFYNALAAHTTIGEGLALRFENHALRAREMPQVDFVLHASQTMIQAKWFALRAADDGAYGVLWRDVTRDQELEDIKNQLLATVSHELRTPLASIKGFATTLLRQDVRWDEATQRDFLRIIEEESNRLEELIDNLLDVAQVQAGGLRIRPEPVQLRRLVREAVEQAQRRTETHWFVMDLPAELPRVWADPRRIRQVLSNLLENAIKYSPDGGEIAVRCEVDASNVMTTIADQGIGIPPEMQARIFDRFFQVDGASTRQVGGSGLGLAIVKGIVEAHHGTVWVESAVGKGSLFRFTLPIVKESDLRQNEVDIEKG